MRHLATRLATLMQRTPDARRGEIGDLLLAALWTLVLASAWCAQPPDRGPWAVYTVLVN